MLKQTGALALGKAVFQLLLKLHGPGCHIVHSESQRSDCHNVHPGSQGPDAKVSTQDHGSQAVTVFIPEGSPPHGEEGPGRAGPALHGAVPGTWQRHQVSVSLAFDLLWEEPWATPGAGGDMDCCQ